MSIIIGDTMTKKEVQLLNNLDLATNILTGAWCYGEKPAKSLRKEMVYLVEELFVRLNYRKADRATIESILDKIGW